MFRKQECKMNSNLYQSSSVYFGLPFFKSTKRIKASEKVCCFLNGGYRAFGFYKDAEAQAPLRTNVSMQRMRVRNFYSFVRSFMSISKESWPIDDADCEQQKNWRKRLSNYLLIHFTSFTNELLEVQTRGSNGCCTVLYVKALVIIEPHKGWKALIE